MGDRRGFALIAALWLMVALTAAGLGFGLLERARHLAAANTVEEARARALAEAGLADTRSRLFRLADVDDDGDMDGWAAALVAPGDTVRLAEGRAVVTLSDPAARLNVNRATEAELRRLFAALRLDYGDADRIAQRIMDWRDADDSRRARGAERDDYVREGMAVAPANGPFTRLAELRDLPGVTPETYDRIRPFLTLEGSGLIGLATASRPVLLSLAGMSEQAVALILKRRTGNRSVPRLTELAAELPAGPRRLLTDSLPVVESRVAYHIRELVASSVGTVEGSPVQVEMRGLFARAGRNVFLVWRQTE
jgi:general secretion pathway protein K